MSSTRVRDTLGAASRSGAALFYFGDAMAVDVALIRDLLMPGMLEISGNYKFVPPMWEEIFAGPPVVDALALPTLSPQVVLAMGAAAVVMKNPEVSRRSFWSWFKR